MVLFSQKSFGLSDGSMPLNNIFTTHTDARCSEQSENVMATAYGHSQDVANTMYILLETHCICGARVFRWICMAGACIVRGEWINVL